MKIIKKLSGEILCSQVKAAKGIGRVIGLIGKKEIRQDEALVISNCHQVHTFFMRFPIGIIFLDPKNKILYTQILKPCQLSSRQKKAKMVIELHPDLLISNKIQLGEEIFIEGMGPLN